MTWTLIFLNLLNLLVWNKCETEIKDAIENNTPNFKILENVTIGFMATQLILIIALIAV